MMNSRIYYVLFISANHSRNKYQVAKTTVNANRKRTNCLGSIPEPPLLYQSNGTLFWSSSPTLNCLSFSRACCVWPRVPFFVGTCFGEISGCFPSCSILKYSWATWVIIKVGAWVINVTVNDNPHVFCLIMLGDLIPCDLSATHLIYLISFIHRLAVITNKLSLRSFIYPNTSKVKPNIST